MEERVRKARVSLWVIGLLLFCVADTIAIQAVIMWWSDMTAKESFVRAWWSASGTTWGIVIGRFFLTP